MSVSKKELSAKTNSSEKQLPKFNPLKKLQLFLHEIGNERFNKWDLVRVFILGFMVTILLTNIIQLTGVDVSARLHKKQISSSGEPKVFETSEMAINSMFVNVLNPIKKNSIKRNLIIKKIPTQINEIELINHNSIIAERIVSKIKQITIQEIIEKEISIPAVKVKNAKEPIIKKATKIVQKEFVPNKKPILVQKNVPNNSWASLHKKAVKEGKGSFIIFGATWCAPCKIMNKSIQQNQNLQVYLKEHQVYKYVDIESKEGKILNLKHQVYTLPSILFFDEYGKLIHREEGAMSSSKLFETLKGQNRKEVSALPEKQDTIEHKVVESTKTESPLDSNQSVIIDAWIDDILEKRAESDK